MEIVFLFWNIAQKMSPIRKNKSTHNPQNKQFMEINPRKMPKKQFLENQFMQK